MGQLFGLRWSERRRLSRQTSSAVVATLYRCVLKQLSIFSMAGSTYSGLSQKSKWVPPSMTNSSWLVGFLVSGLALLESFGWRVGDKQQWRWSQRADDVDGVL
jgi:hypothetical protein